MGLAFHITYPFYNHIISCVKWQDKTHRILDDVGTYVGQSTPNVGQLQKRRDTPLEKAQIAAHLRFRILHLLHAVVPKDHLTGREKEKASTQQIVVPLHQSQKKVKSYSSTLASFPCFPNIEPPSLSCW